MSDTEDLAALNDRLMAKNHALAEALSRAGKELTKAKSQLAQLGSAAAHLRHHGQGRFHPHR